ncbi:hypothetical protein PoB_003493500 [Plakobranchus ocellatus]|uniref:Uncharacterized protein n=1 Tax=Plakobranchus ocellatus TaxID=259542 RepID=A0AAV4ANG9_9GAST|nr:hypothetical protein PoB_003493500 [Plakobranchus ocellatus]
MRTPLASNQGLFKFDKLSLEIYLFILASFAFEILCTQDEVKNAANSEKANQDLPNPNNYFLSQTRTNIMRHFKCDVTGQCISVEVLEPPCSDGYLDPPTHGAGYLKVSLAISKQCSNNSLTIQLVWLWGSEKDHERRQIKRCSGQWTCKVPLRAIMPESVMERWLEVLLYTRENSSSPDFPLTLFLRSRVKRRRIKTEKSYETVTEKNRTEERNINLDLIIPNESAVDESDTAKLEGINSFESPNIDISRKPLATFQMDDYFQQAKPNLSLSNTLSSFTLNPHVSKAISRQNTTAGDNLLKHILRHLSGLRNKPRKASQGTFKSYQSHNRQLTGKTLDVKAVRNKTTFSAKSTSHNFFLSASNQTIKNFTHTSTFPNKKSSNSSQRWAVLQNHGESNPLLKLLFMRDTALKNIRGKQNETNQTLVAGTNHYRYSGWTDKAVPFGLQLFKSLRTRTKNVRGRKRRRRKKSIRQVKGDEATDIAILMEGESKEDRNKIATMIASDFDSTGGLPDPVVTLPRKINPGTMKKYNEIKKLDHLIEVIEDEEDNVFRNVPPGADDESLMLQACTHQYMFIAFLRGSEAHMEQVKHQIKEKRKRLQHIKEALNRANLRVVAANMDELGKAPAELIALRASLEVKASNTESDLAKLRDTYSDLVNGM